MEAVALVTGGASGLGKCTVQHLLKHGFKVALLDLPLSNGAFLAKSMGQDCIFVQADIAEDEEVRTGILEVKKNFGRLDAVINCAGIAFNRKSYSFNTPDRVQKSAAFSNVAEVFKVNVGGAFNVIRHALDLFSRNEKDEAGCRGVVVNTSSFASFEPQFGQVSDALSSGAMNSATRALAKDYASDGIRFIAIAPGIFRTPMMTFHMTELNMDVYRKLVPLPERLGLPEEFAALVLHVIRNRYINGEVIRLDGALRMPA